MDRGVVAGVAEVVAGFGAVGSPFFVARYGFSDYVLIFDVFVVVVVFIFAVFI